jgi:hypothetical protein
MKRRKFIAGLGGVGAVIIGLLTLRWLLMRHPSGRSTELR